MARLRIHRPTTEQTWRVGWDERAVRTKKQKQTLTTTRSRVQPPLFFTREKRYPLDQ